VNIVLVNHIFCFISMLLGSRRMEGTNMGGIIVLFLYS
jgi:hypothetical protein